MRKWVKRLFGIVAVVVVVGVVIMGLVLGPYTFRVQQFSADPIAGYHSDFFLYISPAARRTAADGGIVTLLVQPNNSGVTSDDPGVHRSDAWWMGFGRSSLAEELGVVLLVPALPRPSTDWQVYTHALDRDTFTTMRRDLARLDLQLLAMVDRARSSLEADGLPTDDKFLIQGFSASGMFANRFACLHPTRVKAVAAGSPGGWPIAPVSQWEGEALPYPAGVADLAELTGQPFDAKAYAAVPQLIAMGSLDDNDSLDFRDGWDKAPAELVDRLFGPDPLSRWRHAEAIYRLAGADVRFQLVEGVGHERKKLQASTTQFFSEVLNRGRSN